MTQQTLKPTGFRRHLTRRALVLLVLSFVGLFVTTAVSPASAHASSRATVDVTALPHSEGTPLWIGTCNTLSAPDHASSYCDGGSGSQFRTHIVCVRLGGSTYHAYGPWEWAGGGVRSVAHCLWEDRIRTAEIQKIY